METDMDSQLHNDSIGFRRELGRQLRISVVATALRRLDPLMERLSVALYRRSLQRSARVS